MVHLYIQFNLLTPSSTHQQLIAAAGAAGAAAGHYRCLAEAHHEGRGARQGRKTQHGANTFEFFGGVPEFLEMQTLSCFLKSIGPNRVFRVVSPAMGKSLAQLLAAKKDQKVKVVKNLSWFD